MIYLVSSEDEKSEVIQSFKARHTIVKYLQYKLIKHPDGEIEVYFLDLPEKLNKVVLLFTSSAESNTRILELYFLLNIINQCRCKSLVLSIPYFFYARHDRRYFAHSITQVKYVIDLLNYPFVKDVVFFDIHNPLILKYFHCRVHDLSPGNILYEYVKTREVDYFNNITLIAPDVGATNRVKEFAHYFKCKYFVFKKKRVAKEVRIEMGLENGIENMNYLICDDIVDTAGTLIKTAEYLYQYGARNVSAFCTHSVLSAKAVENIEKSKLRELIVTNSILRNITSKKIRILDIYKDLGKFSKNLLLK